jgi:hypothetical protein
MSMVRRLPGPLPTGDSRSRIGTRYANVSRVIQQQEQVDGNVGKKAEEKVETARK